MPPYCPQMCIRDSVYTFRANGFAWTDDYQGDDTDWQYGLTRDGNLLIKMLTVIKITADQIDVYKRQVRIAAMRDRRVSS